MRRMLAVTALALRAAANAGCAYARDRWADAKDVFTLAGGLGIGAVARVGPVQTGLGVELDGLGLVGGRLVDGGLGPCGGVGGATTLTAAAIIPGHGASGMDEQRGKNYDVDYAVVPFRARVHPRAAYYTQIEVAGGVVLGVHAGLNPGELVDFVLGFVGVDLYGDDVATDPPAATSRSVPGSAPTAPAPATASPREVAP